MAIEGIDYAFPPRPAIAELVRLGKQFACRYGGPGTLDKQLDPQEARDLSAAGIAIVANAEGAANGLAGGWPAGVSWATKAEARFAECGMPPDRPIYFSVDFDVVAEAWPNVRDALRGAASVLGDVDRVGVYGGRAAVEWARRDGVASWFWQTYAWSGGRWAPGNHIEQYRNGVDIAGADCDLNRALQSDYGQWMTGDNMLTDEEKAVIGELLTLVRSIAGRTEAQAKFTDTTTWAGMPDGRQEDMLGNQALKQVAADLKGLKTGGIDIAELAAQLAPLLPKPPTAEEVADVIAARLRS